MAGIYNGPARGGNRGGKDLFNWEDVKEDKQNQQKRQMQKQKQRQKRSTEVATLIPHASPARVLTTHAPTKHAPAATHSYGNTHLRLTAKHAQPTNGNTTHTPREREREKEREAAPFSCSLDCGRGHTHSCSSAVVWSNRPSGRLVSLFW